MFLNGEWTCRAKGRLQVRVEIHDCGFDGYDAVSEGISE